ncbi:hypothetical protein OAO34_02940 [Candidatus Poseidoniaceae archaeon]|nr:hypothetical protein [Candidatus Poseidoniaceae archaeon]
MGSVYPLWIEKLVFVGLIATCIYGGLLLQDYTSGVVLWATRLCIMPIAILVTVEGVGRIIQAIYTK